MGVTNTDRSLRIIRNINACGISKLRLYCTTKPYPVKNFDRDITVIRCALRYGTTYASDKYSMAQQNVDGLLRRYEKYAIACLQA